VRVTVRSSGDTVDGTLTGAPPGQHDVLFEGSTVTQVTVLPVGPGETTSATFSFTVPPLDPGRYEVVIVGDTFNVSCAFTRNQGRRDRVGGVVIERGSDPDGGGGGGVGALPFTGADLLAAIALAVALILLGLVLRRRSRGGADHEALPW
jgi:hypothetical protein